MNWMETKMHIYEKNRSQKRCVRRVRRSYDFSDVFRHDFFMLWQSRCVFDLMCKKIIENVHGVDCQDIINLVKETPSNAPGVWWVDRCWWVVEISSPPWWCIKWGPFFGSIVWIVNLLKRVWNVWKYFFLECRMQIIANFHLCMKTLLNY